MAKIDWPGMTPKTDLGGISSPMLVLNGSEVETLVLWPKHNPNIEQNDKEIALKPVEAEDKAVIMQALYSYYHWAASECLDNDYEKALDAIRRMESYMPENEKSFKPTLKDGDLLCGNCGCLIIFPKNLRIRCPWCQKKVRWEDD